MTDSQLSTRLAARFGHELVAALAAAIGATVTAEPATAPAVGRGLLLSAQVSGAQTGVIVAWIEAGVADAAVRAATGAEGEPALDDVINLVREMATHALAIISLAPDFAGLRFSVSAITPGSAPVMATLLQFPMSAETVGLVGVSASLTAVPDAHNVRQSGNLDMVLDVELPLVVRFGRTTLTLKALAGLGPGSIVDMGRSPDEPVELLVSDKVIAYGEVVIVDGSYGLRITDLVSRTDRIRALETR
jgi:flagellar motor switch protein FliN